MTLGTKLLELRTKNQLTQIQVAEKLEISQTAYNKWESDLAKPTTDNLFKICELYQIDVYKLLENVSNINFSKAKFTNSSNIVSSNNFTVNHTQPEVFTKRFRKSN
jgi:transcriptional regulator with XRE-family HTH domain